MEKELLITQILDCNQMKELIDIFNKQVRPKKKEGGMIFEPERHTQRPN